MPSGLLMSSLVDIEMSYGDMEMFEVPMVLNSLKILNLKGCDKLVSIRNLSRLPKLMALILWNCSSLTHLCKTMGELESLITLDLKGCTKLWKCENQFETKIIPKQSVLSLPPSLRQLDLGSCDLDFKSDVYMEFPAGSLAFLCLGCNLFEFLPNNIDLNFVRVLNLYSCSKLKFLPCIPSTLVELYIDWCTSLEIITFQSGCFSLKEFSCKGCLQLSEIEGLLKLVPIAKIKNADLGHMQWIKAYENDTVDLIGDDITKGRIWHTQMLYEYGIMSTYLQGIKDQILPKYEHTSTFSFISFCVPSNYEKNMIQGLHLSCLYRSIGTEDKYMWNLWAKISNITKGLTWVYNPTVYCKPKVDEDIVWLSYWPIGNMLDADDEVSVDFFVPKGRMVVSGCGANLMYMDDEVEEDKNCEDNYMMSKDVEEIGGDLSEFKVTTGSYYLCRRDVFGSHTSSWLKWFFGNNVHYTDSQGWRKTHQTERSREIKDFTNTFLKIIELGVGFNTESEIDNMKKVVWSLVGVESVSAHKEMRKLVVTGHVDPIEVATCVRGFGNMVVEILSVKTIVD